MLRILLALGLCLLSWISWAADNSDPNLHIRKDGLNSFAGDYQSGANHIDFNAYAPNAKTVEINVRVNRKVFDAELDLYHENIRLDGHDSKLESPEKTALLAASQAITEYVQSQYFEFDPQYFMLIRMLSYWGHAPAGYQHAKREIVSAPSPNEEQP